MLKRFDGGSRVWTPYFDGVIIACGRKNRLVLCLSHSELFFEILCLCYFEPPLLNRSVIIEPIDIVDFPGKNPSV